MNFVQYIVVRKDLATHLNWTLGAIVAQGCHAATAALTLYNEHPDTKKYIKNLENMHKVVLAIDNEEKLNDLVSTLVQSDIDYFLWNEQPENIPTALATRPYAKESICLYFKNLRLLK